MVYVFDFGGLSWGVLHAVCAVEEGQSIIRDSIEQVDNPHHSTMTCTAGL